MGSNPIVSATPHHKSLKNSIFCLWSQFWPRLMHGTWENNQRRLIPIFHRTDPDHHGLFSDARFTWGGRQVVSEAQLATIALVTIDRRRSRNDKGGFALIGVMRRFDPNTFIRASVLDVAADQVGVVFDWPDSLVASARAAGIMRLRQWRRGDHGKWFSETVTLGQARPQWRGQGFGLDPSSACRLRQ
jgi:hypothetical protein